MTLFGLPYYKVKIIADSYDKENIVKTIENNYQRSSYRNKWDKHSLNSSNFHHSNHDENNTLFARVDYSSLIPVYKDIIESFIVAPYKHDIVNYTVCNEGQYMKYHDHIFHCDFFMIHYVQFDKQMHEPTLYKNTHIFSDYFEDLRYDTFVNSADNMNNAWMRKEIALDVEEDSVVIVPSAVPHMIPPMVQKSPINRITIVSNITLQHTKGEV